mgnify:CR=1 FL=1
MKTKLILSLVFSLLLPLTMQTVVADESKEIHSTSVSSDGVEVNADERNVKVSKKEEAPFSEEFESDMDMEVLIPIFGIVFTFGTPIIIIWIVAAYGARRRRLMHDTIVKIVESGQPIPAQIFEEIKPNDAANSARHKGLVLTFLGLAVGIALSSIVSPDIATIALIPMFMGLAYLCSWKLSRNDKKPGSVE